MAKSIKTVESRIDQAIYASPKRVSKKIKQPLMMIDEFFFPRLWENHHDDPSRIKHVKVPEQDLAIRPSPAIAMKIRTVDCSRFAGSKSNGRLDKVIFGKPNPINAATENSVAKTISCLTWLDRWRPESTMIVVTMIVEDRGSNHLTGILFKGRQQIAGETKCCRR